MNRDQIISVLEEDFASVDELLGGLSDAEWAVQSLCPDWDMRGVAIHLSAIEHMLTGWQPDSLETPLPFHEAAAYMEEAAALDNRALLARYRSVIDARRDDLAARTAADLERPTATPVGPGTIGRFLAIRGFDFWVHEQDMRIPLGKRVGEGGLRAQVALDEVHRSLGYIVGKKIGLPDQTGIAFHLHGGIEADLFAAVDGRAGVVDTLADPDVEVWADSTEFIMLACGRIDPDQSIAAGRISWSGEPGSTQHQLGEKAARNLAFTM